MTEAITVYIPPQTLIFLLFAYMLFLLSSEWAVQPEGAWYRPFVLCLAVIALAAWAYRKDPPDEL